MRPVVAGGEVAGGIVGYRYIRNFYPERPFLQLNRYQEFTYPMIPVTRELHAAGELTPVQARLLAPTRPDVIQYWEDRMHEVYGDPR